MRERDGDWAVKPAALAECQDCGWRLDAKNAHGAGVQHSRRHAHHVRIEVVRAYHYGDSVATPTPEERPDGQ